MSRFVTEFPLGPVLNRVATGKSAKRLKFPARIGGCLLITGILLLTPPAEGVPPFDGAEAFVTEYCADCHDDLTKKAGLDLLSFPYAPDDPDNYAKWVRVHDRLESGEMPPEDEPRPDAETLREFITGLASTLIDSEQAIIEENGRAKQRRLNRYEFENTLRDLLSIPWVEVKDRMPEDGEAYRYNKVGEALDVSHIQMARYMDSADYAMRQAMSAKLDHPETTSRRYYARNQRGLSNYRPREGGTLPDRHSFPVLDSHAQPDVRWGRAPNTSPETREREAVGRVSSIFSDAGGYSWSEFRAPTAGKYRLRFKGYTIWVSGGGIGRWYFEGFGNEKAPYYYLPLWHRPNSDEVWPGRNNEPIGVYASGGGQNRPLAEFDFEPEPTVHEVEVMLKAGEVVRTDGMRFFRTRVNGSDEQYVNPLATPEGMPGYAVQWMETDGPLYDGSEGAGYELLFGNLAMRRLDDGETGGVEVEAMPQQPGGNGAVGLRGGGRGRVAFGGRGGRGRGRGRGRGFGGGPREVAVEVVSANPHEDAQRLLRTFMDRAYRRPVEDSEVELFMGLFNSEFDKGYGFTKSLLTAYTAVLSSPGFLFTDETPGKLDDYALASRLSYFLWNSEPDVTLRSLAANGELSRPEVLRAQTERLLSDPKSRRFVDAFTDYWLDIRKIDDNSPSTTLYNDYELDDPLKLASIDETRLFFAELVDKNLPARNIVDSDFTFLNERLAKHYDIENVAGAKMRKVELPDDSLRGGLMTQASVLKITANGTTTSPVLRGNWITERILGYQTPPPPPVPAVEPDIRGAVTIRQQLELHRSDPSCASCHSKMDPPGLALENFDIMGGQRDRYRAVNEEAEPEVGFGMDGQAFAFHHALPVDSEGVLEDGREFDDVNDLKALLLEDEEPIAKNIIEQLTIYATGAPVRFSERKKINEILEATRDDDFGIRGIIHEIVQSELFREK